MRMSDNSALCFYTNSALLRDATRRDATRRHLFSCKRTAGVRSHFKQSFLLLVDITLTSGLTGEGEVVADGVFSLLLSEILFEAVCLGLAEAALLKQVPSCLCLLVVIFDGKRFTHLGLNVHNCVHNLVALKRKKFIVRIVEFVTVDDRVFSSETSDSPTLRQLRSVLKCQHRHLLKRKSFLNLAEFRSRQTFVLEFNSSQSETQTWVFA